VGVGCAGGRTKARLCVMATKKAPTHPDELLEAAVLVGAIAPVLVGVEVENEVIVKVCAGPVEVSTGAVGVAAVVGVVEVSEVVVEEEVVDVVVEVG
jgi:hypothetical protein